MQPAKGTRLFFLDNEGVLFDERSQKLFQLNTIVTFIWCHLEEGASRTLIRKALCKTFGLSEAEAHKSLKAAGRLLQSVGVLKGARAAPPTTAKAPEPPQACYLDEQFVAIEHYQLLSSCFCVRFSSEAQRAKIAPIFGHLRLSDLTVRPFQKEPELVDILNGDDSFFTIHLNRRPALRCTQLDELAPLVKSLIWQTAISLHEFFLDIHAGVVGDGERCFLFPAPQGSGKSTLTVALAARGFEYFSDEVALLHLPEMWVEPVPLAACVKDSGVAVLLGDLPNLEALAVHRRGDGKRVRYLPPTSPRPQAPTQRPVGAIVFPCYSPESADRLERISSMEALQALMAECLIVATRLNESKVSALLGWLASTPCYRLWISDLGAAVDTVRGLSAVLKCDTFETSHAEHDP